MRIKIQPKEQSDFTLPYPYFIEKGGLVGRQDFWKGHPYKLIGFSCKCKAGNCDILFKDFWKNPKLSVEKYPVFSDQEGSFFTSKTKISNFEVIKN